MRYDTLFKVKADPVVRLGIAIYFYSPLWPFRVSTALSLDGASAQTVDLTDNSVPTVDDGPETVQSQVVWSLVGLENTEHTLVISVATGEDIAILDALMCVTRQFIVYLFFDIGTQVHRTRYR